MDQNYNSKKKVFLPLRDYIYLKDSYKNINDVRLSSFNNLLLIKEVKSLKVIELDNLESFTFYLNYDHYLIFKYEDNYYFCDTELAIVLGINSMLKITDYSLYLRKDKIKKIIQK